MMTDSKKTDGTALSHHGQPRFAENYSVNQTEVCGRHEARNCAVTLILKVIWTRLLVYQTHLSCMHVVGWNRLIMAIDSKMNRDKGLLPIICGMRPSSSLTCRMTSSSWFSNWSSACSSDTPESTILNLHDISRYAVEIYRQFNCCKNIELSNTIHSLQQCRISAKISAWMNSGAEISSS